MQRDAPFPASSLVDKVYHRVKQDLFDFQLLPGDRFTETEVAERTSTSRTPVREALMRLEREGYLHMKPRAGWQVKPFDFRLFQELYDLRTILETASIRRWANESPLQTIRDLQVFWSVPVWERLKEGQRLSQADEDFHHRLVDAAGNSEVTRLHSEVTQRIRIVRRLDFTNEDRRHATYEDHSAILEALAQDHIDQACTLLEVHIAVSQAAVQTITLARLEAARSLRFEQ